jgi:hypothetical protein
MALDSALPRLLAAVLLGGFLAACAKKVEQPISVSTCQLNKSGDLFTGKRVMVRAVVLTDMMHFQHIETPGCSGKVVSMYFADDAVNHPCGDSDFAKTVECPLMDAISWRIEATFIGEYDGAKNSLRVTEMKDISRTKNPPWTPSAT